MSHRLAATRLVLVSAAFLACRGSDPPARGHESRALAFTPAVALRHPAGTVLARPDLISEDAAGRTIITDYSDRNAKVYDHDGGFVRSIGRPGRGPGEFQSLMVAQPYRDSVVAYDLASSRLSVFGPDGRYARSVPVPTSPVTYSVRVVDDSLFLLIGAPQGEQKPLLTFLRPDGTVRSRFLPLRAYLGTNPQVLSLVGVVADGADGTVFAAVVGGDSVWAFDYDGRRLASFAADPVRPLKTVRALVEANGGRARQGRGWVVDGVPRLNALVALDSGTVALQIAPYDGHLGVDPVDGGTVVVSAVDGSGAHMLTRSEVRGGALGRDRRNRLFVLRYASADGDSYELLRAGLAPARSR